MCHIMVLKKHFITVYTFYCAFLRLKLRRKFMICFFVWCALQLSICLRWIQHRTPFPRMHLCLQLWPPWTPIPRSSWPDHSLYTPGFHYPCYINTLTLKGLCKVFVQCCVSELMYQACVPCPWRLIRSVCGFCGFFCFALASNILCRVLPELLPLFYCLWASNF